MTRRKLGRIKVRPPEQQELEKYLIRLSGWQLYHETDRLPRFSSESLFGCDRPLELDVGCGTGELVCHLAAKHPEANFVGVDQHVKSLYKAIRTASSEDLDNLRFVGGDFRQMYPLLVPEALRAVYLHFPDPGIKPRYKKRRIFSERFLSEIHRATVPGGRLSVVTDDEDYFTHMLKLIERDARWNRAHPERYLTEFEPEIKSRFYRMWERRGRSVFRFELVKPVATDDHAPEASKVSMRSRTEPGIGTARPSFCE